MSRVPKPPRNLKQKVITPTGIRRFFKLELLGKRRRDQSERGSPGPVLGTSLATKSRPQILSRDGKENVIPPSPALPPVGQNIRLPTRVALQNEDITEDAVVITALDKIPFCCHEDLMTMSREQLITVALSLNAKLPAAMAIDVSHIRPTSFIRSSIELIVGIRGDVPQAPKPVRSRPESQIYVLDSVSDLNVSPPTSPLAKRSRNNLHTSLISPRLERLDEVEEVDTMTDRYRKRRRVLAELVSPAEASYTDVDIMAEPKIDSPTPVSRTFRAQPHRIVPHRSPSARTLSPCRIPRPQSNKLEKATTATPGIDTTFVNTRRPAPYRYRTKAKQGKETDFSPQLRGRKNVGRLRPISVQRNSLAPASNESRSRRSRSSMTVASCSSEMSAEDEDMLAPVLGAKRKRSFGRTEGQMVAGIEGMNMGMSIPNDMDFS